MIVFLLEFAVFFVIWQHLRDIKLLFLYRKTILLDFMGILLSHSEFHFLSIEFIFLGRSTNERMIKGLLIDGHIFTCMRINVKCFHIVPISETIRLIVRIISAIVLKTLTVKIFSKCRVREIPRLIFHLFVIFFYIFLSWILLDFLFTLLLWFLLHNFLISWWNNFPLFNFILPITILSLRLFWFGQIVRWCFWFFIQIVIC